MLRALLTLALVAAGASGAAAQTKVPFALDWKFEGPSSAYFAAIDNGHFAAEGLEVEISAGKGSLDAIPKVATGAFPVGFACMAIEFLRYVFGAETMHSGQAGIANERAELEATRRHLTDARRSP